MKALSLILTTLCILSPCWGNSTDQALPLYRSVTPETPFSERQIMICCGTYSDREVQEIRNRADRFFPYISVTPYLDANGVPSRIILCANYEIRDVQFNLHENEIDGYFDFKLLDDGQVRAHFFASQKMDDSIVQQASITEHAECTRSVLILLPAQYHSDVWDFTHTTMKASDEAFDQTVVICSKTMIMEAGAKTDTDGQSSANVGVTYESRHDNRSASVSGSVGVERDSSGHVHGEAQVAGRVEYNF